MSDFKSLANQAAVMDDPGTLKFSTVHVPGFSGYQWHSVKANNATVARFLLACWNNRKLIAELLRKEG